MKTKYTAKIRQLLEGKLDEEDFKTWIQEQPLLDQAEIFREIKATVEAKVPSELLEETEISTLDESIDAFEDKVLDIKLAQQLEIAEIENLSELNQDIENTYETMRKRVNFCIINNEPSAEFMKIIAEKMIAAEKDYNRFDTENWPALPYL